MLEVVPSLTRRERSAKIVITHKAHISTQILTLSSGFLVQHLLMPLVCFTNISFCLCMLNFYILQIYEHSELPVPSRTNLSCRRATLCKDSEL